jgi:hypothetical protein
VSLPTSYRSRRGNIHLLRVLPLVGCRSKTPTETKTSNSFELDETSIPCAIPISKVDASNSCIDLIDESCSPSCHENAVVETCDYLIGKENGELKQEVKWLRERLANLMGKGKNDEEQVDVSRA